MLESAKGPTRSSFLFDSAMRSNYSLGHDRAGDPDKWEINLPLASSTLHTTASDLAKFGAHLAAEIRSGGPYSALATPAVTIEEVDGVERSWGSGLERGNGGSTPIRLPHGQQRDLHRGLHVRRRIRE